MNPIFTALIGPISDLLGKVIPDLDERKRMAFEIATLTEKQTHAEMMGQIEVNKVEAAHKSLFVAGWRPFIGWVGGLGFGYNVLVHPILSAWYTMPDVNPDLLYPTLFGMLGMGTLRSYEKINGVAREK